MPDDRPEKAATIAINYLFISNAHDADSHDNVTIVHHSIPKIRSWFQCIIGVFELFLILEDNARKADANQVARAFPVALEV